MDPYHRSGQSISPYFRYIALCVALTLIGCASPGPPRAPSLQLPQPVRNLTAQRIGNTVELHFTAPASTTDKVDLRGPTLSGQLCRQLPHQPCLPVSPRTSISIDHSHGSHNFVTWTDTLPPTLANGIPQLITYRVEFFSPASRSAGPSNQAFTASGQAPASVENLHAEGSRLGTIILWSPSETPGDVVLRRENLSPATSKSKPIIWLQTNDANSAINRTLDTTALPATPYRYTAQRRSSVHLGDRTIELRSELSAPIVFTLSQTYPPPAPTGLNAAGYSTETSAFAIDLIWQPVNETGLVTPLAGYNLYRETLDAAGRPTSPSTQLNTSPIPQPSFHDATANAAATYRYRVTAIDAKGNQSPAITLVVPPSTKL